MRQKIYQIIITIIIIIIDIVHKKYSRFKLR
jgi:hypothetical protein